MATLPIKFFKRPSPINLIAFQGRKGFLMFLFCPLSASLLLLPLSVCSEGEDQEHKWPLLRTDTQPYFIYMNETSKELRLSLIWCSLYFPSFHSFSSELPLLQYFLPWYERLRLIHMLQDCFCFFSLCAIFKRSVCYCAVLKLIYTMFVCEGLGDLGHLWWGHWSKHAHPL